MMQVYKIKPVGFASNCYLLTADGKEAVAIDPSQPRVIEEAKKLGLQIKYVLLTHGHFDHIGGCAACEKEGVQIGCLDREVDFALHANELAYELGESAVLPFSVSFTVTDGEIVSLCGMDFHVMATPGHTAGSACYLTEDKIFSGDTLFLGCVGRWDLPTGNRAAVFRSVKRLYELKGDYIVYPGHGENTTLETERKTNGAVRA